METTLDTRQLLNFLAVCEKKSFAKAANVRFITQQGLSTSIKQLEDRLGVQLFVRTPKGVIPTECGKILRDSVIPYLDQQERIIRTLKGIQKKYHQEIRLSISVDFYKDFPKGFFADFIKTHPDYTMNISSFDTDTFQKSVIEKNMHIGFTMGPIDDENFESYLLWKNKTTLLASKNHPFSSKSSVTMAELRDEAIIILANSKYQSSIPYSRCIEHGIVPQIQLNVYESDLVHELCATNTMLAIWGSAVAPFDDLAIIEIADMNIECEFFLVINKNTQLNNAENVFLGYAKERLRR